MVIIPTWVVGREPCFSTFWPISHPQGTSIGLYPRQSPYTSRLRLHPQWEVWKGSAPAATDHGHRRAPAPLAAPCSGPRVPPTLSRRYGSVYRGMGRKEACGGRPGDENFRCPISCLGARGDEVRTESTGDDPDFPSVYGGPQCSRPPQARGALKVRRGRSPPWRGVTLMSPSPMAAR